ncbi:MAG: family 2 glycosyl transferase, partial [Rhodopirellula sp.]|nr:family 2 glycosyl transferase [Rhodopirellula sp.]
ESEYIKRTILSLRNSHYPKDKYEIIVVDNGSSDDTYEISTVLADKVLRLIEGNVGAVRNFGARNSKGEILAFIDADCLIENNWLDNINELIKNNANAIFGGTCTLSDESNWIEHYWLLGDANKRQRDLVGASIALRKALFFDLGGFSETLTSGEDTEFSVRARSRNINIEINPLLSVVHMGNAKTTMSFFKRQMWHSENYFLDLPASLRDPTFILCVIASVSLAGAIIYAADRSYHSLLFLGIFFSIVLIFSIKRMYYANTLPKKLTGFLRVYWLDLIYVTARIVGGIKSAFLAITRKN